MRYGHSVKRHSVGAAGYVETQSQCSALVVNSQLRTTRAMHRLATNPENCVHGVSGTRAQWLRARGSAGISRVQAPSDSGRPTRGPTSHVTAMSCAPCGQSKALQSTWRPRHELEPACGTDERARPRSRYPDGRTAHPSDLGARATLGPSRRSSSACRTAQMHGANRTTSTAEGSPVHAPV